MSHKKFKNTDECDDNSTSSQQTSTDNLKNEIQESKNERITEHQLSVEQVCDKYGTDLQLGLDQGEALDRLQRDGPNSFTPPREKPWYILFLKEITGGFALLLWASAIGSFVSFGVQHDVEDAYLGGILVFTVLVTGIFSYYQQMSSSKVFRSFQNMTPQTAFVLRNGKKQQIPVEEIVVGDVVFCNAGDRIPADIRVVHSDSMKVDNSSITGESEPLLRSVEAVNSSVLEARNLAFFSTNCTDGNGIGLVIATGDRTIMGDIAAIVSNTKHGDTPIAKEISHFVKIITVLSVVSGLAFGGIYYWFGTSFFNSFLFMIGITVGNVPEGLLPALTVALTITAKRMAAKKCLVKHLEAVETLGSTSTICTDKTGTLTQNRMTVAHLWFGGETYFFKDGMLLHDIYDSDEIQLKLDWLALKRCAMLCSRAEFLDDNTDLNERKCMGDASETGIMKFLEQVTTPVEEYRALYPKVSEKPFSSTYKYQYSIHQCMNAITGTFGSHFLVMKGAPERILELCTRRVDKFGNTVPIEENFVQQFESVYREYGSQGERVLAFCDLELSIDQFGPDYKFNLATLDETIRLENLRFLGLISMMDPPRPGVPQAVKLCRNAGIRVVMVTGDHPITAQAIANMVGIISSPHRGTSITLLGSTVSYDNEKHHRIKSIVVPGNELASMAPEQLEETLLLYEEIVFARTTPKQKLRIVETFQRLGEIVAVTGDGVNDSPALKKADIGIAMGISGSEVSKQAADMILLDDNFSTIVVGIEEGRRIFDNMKKTTSYILAGNVTTIYPFVVYASTGIPLAITTISALLISLGTDIVPAISLSYEKAELDIMSIKPRQAKKDRLVDWKLLFRAYAYIGIICTCSAFAGYFVTMNMHGYTPPMLWESRLKWNDKHGHFPRIVGYDSHHQPIMANTTYAERLDIQQEAQSAYFSGVVVAQWIDVIVCKTRRVSVFAHGMGNWILNISILFETGLTAFAIYVPWMNHILQTQPVQWTSWLWTLPTIGIMLLLEEIRKAIIRTFPDSPVGRALLA